MSNTKSSKVHHTSAGVDRFDGLFSLFLIFKNWCSNKSKWGFTYKPTNQPTNQWVSFQELLSLGKYRPPTWNSLLIYILYNPAIAIMSSEGNIEPTKKESWVGVEIKPRTSFSLAWWSLWCLYYCSHSLKDSMSFPLSPWGWATVSTVPPNYRMMSWNCCSLQPLTALS